jgi:hypothetical protein
MPFSSSPPPHPTLVFNIQYIRYLVSQVVRGNQGGGWGGARRLITRTSGTSFILTGRRLLSYGISSASDDDSAYSSMFIRRVGTLLFTDIGVVTHFTCGRLGIDRGGGADGIGCKGISSLDILVGLGVSFFRP